MLTVNLVEKNLLQFVRIERFSELSIARVLNHLSDMDQDAEVEFSLDGFGIDRANSSKISLQLNYGLSTVGEIFDTLDQFLRTGVVTSNGRTEAVTEETILSLGAFQPLNLMTLAILVEEGIEAAFDYNKQTVRS
jgi:hypothetical protein